MDTNEFFAPVRATTDDTNTATPIETQSSASVDAGEVTSAKPTGG